MDQLRSRFSVRSCARVLGLRRATYYSRRQGRRPEEEDAAIAAVLHEAAGQYLAWSFRMIFRWLRRQGHRWNHKRVYRIWKAEGLNLRRPPQRSGVRREFRNLTAPALVNEGWAMDFLSDWVIGPSQVPVRIINIMDECSRKVLWTEACQSITARTLTGILGKVVAWRGKPAYASASLSTGIRLDNGPEFISRELEQWAHDGERPIELRFIQPGKPTQNGLIERLNGTLRRECLSLAWFESLEALNGEIQQWWITYNTVRPHSSLGYLTPDEFEEQQQKFSYSVVAA
ncbi:MAG: IS3 family transposase [Bacteroidia bacterium]|nr:IS3 family transposase [Bacteroidia bacterium]